MADYLAQFQPAWEALHDQFGESTQWTHTTRDGATATSVDVIVTDSNDPDDLVYTILFEAADVAATVTRRGDTFTDPSGVVYTVEGIEFNRNGINRATARTTQERT